MCTHHPSSELLTGFVTGSVSDGVALAISAHLTFCPSCRKEVSAMEALAGGLLEAEEPVTPPSFEALLGHLDDEIAITEEPKTQNAGPLPSAVAAAIGTDFEDIQWKFRLPGVSEYEFQSEDGETVSLLRVRPGAKIPHHTHKAEELTVVFAGELVDGDTRFHSGDIAVADPSVHHHPQAGGTETCVCLAVVNGGLRFTGPFGRALNLFT